MGSGNPLKMGTCWFLRIIAERLSARHLHRAAEFDGSAYYYFVRHALLRMRASVGCHAKSGPGPVGLVLATKPGPPGPLLAAKSGPGEILAHFRLKAICYVYRRVTHNIIIAEPY